MRRLLPGLALLVAVTACVPADGPTVTPPPPATSTTGTVAINSPPPTTSPPTTVAEGACPEGDVMLADGGLVTFDRPASDGARLAGITWRTVGQCQTFTISFATEDGAPATTPPSLNARLVRDAGVLRVETTATESVVVGQLVEEGSVERLFVPVDENGSRFVDLVLGGSSVARARVLTSPARLEIELQPGGPETIGHPLITPELVVVAPGSSAVAQALLDITGYATGSLEELNVAVERGAETLLETTLELEPSPGVWSAFHHTLSVGTDLYDTLRITGEDDAVLAAIPFSR